MLSRLRDREYKRAINARLSGNAPLTEIPPGGQTQRVFCRALFLVMGKLAKLDGRVSEVEVEFATSTMHTLGLNPDQRHSAIDCFYAGKIPELDIQPSINDMLHFIGSGSPLARQFLKTQCRLAFAKGVIRIKEKVLLRDVAESLGFDKSELLRIYTEIQVSEAPGHRRRAGSLSTAYQILGLSPAADEQEIRRAYRRLVARYHPDKVAVHCSDAGDLRAAQDKFQSVRHAYEDITRFRKTALL